MPRIATRESDLFTLSLLKARTKGFTMKQVAKQFGTTEGAVEQRTSAVLRDDEAADPADFDRTAYWPAKEKKGVQI